MANGETMVGGQNQPEPSLTNTIWPPVVCCFGGDQIGLPMDECHLPGRTPCLCQPCFAQFIHCDPFSEIRSGMPSEKGQLISQQEGQWLFEWIDVLLCGFCQCKSTPCDNMTGCVCLVLHSLSTVATTFRHILRTLGAFFCIRMVHSSNLPNHARSNLPNHAEHETTSQLVFSGSCFKVSPLHTFVNIPN